MTADGAIGTIGRSAPTPVRAPRGIAVLAASVIAIDRHQRMEASGAWVTATKWPIAHVTEAGPNGQPGRPVRRPAAWPSRHAGDPAATRNQLLAVDFASVPTATKSIARAILLAR